MQLKKIAQVMLVAGVFVLSACSSLHRHTSGSGVESGSDAETTAMNGDEGVNGEDTGGESLAKKRIYYFDFDKSNVQETDRPAIVANADYLIAHPGTKIILEGHTDPRGSREYNVALGERRANAVLDILRERGVNSGQVRVVSYGAERPAVAGHTETVFQQDRRAVIVVEQG